MKRRKPVSYAEDSDSEDFSDSEYYGRSRRRDFDDNKFRNGNNRESQSGYRS